MHNDAPRDEEPTGEKPHRDSLRGVQILIVPIDSLTGTPLSHLGFPYYIDVWSNARRQERFCLGDEVNYVPDPDDEEDKGLPFPMGNIKGMVFPNFLVIGRGRFSVTLPAEKVTRVEKLPAIIEEPKPKGLRGLVTKLLGKKK